MTVRKTLLLISLLTVAGSVPAQYAIRPGLELPEISMNTLRAPLRGEPTDLPSHLDNSLSDFFPAIVSQYGGSCAQAAGIHYLFTYEMNRTLDRKVQNKKEYTFSYRWIWHILNGGKDEGGFSSDGIEVTQTAGCMSVADYGDESDSDFKWPTGYNKYYNAIHYRTKSMSKIDLSTMEGIHTMMQYMNDKNDGLKGGGIAAFSISNDLWSYEDYDGPSETGYEEIINMKGKGGAHAMTLVGYDLSVEYDCNGDSTISDDEKGAFILVNSWGSWWGTNGRAYIPFKYFLEAGQDDAMTRWDAAALCIETEYFVPTTTLKLKMNYSSRNDIVTRFGLADGNHNTSPLKGTTVQTPILKGSGGDHNMQGTRFVSGNTIEMGFDLSSLTTTAQSMKAPCWMIIMGKSVIGKTGTGRILSASVYDYTNGNEYSVEYTDDMNAITVGYHMFKVPTTNMFIRNNTWYESFQTSSNILMQPKDYVNAPEWTRSFGIRTANGSHAKIKVKEYDPKTRKLTIDIKHYE